MTTIREGFIGNVRVTGMPDEMSMQLCGVGVLVELGYSILIDSGGCMIGNRFTGYALDVTWRDGLFIFDIRNILEFVETFDPAKHNRQEVFSMESSNIE